MKKVEYCQKSSITEAWAVVYGAAGEVNDSEVGALENFAAKKIGDFQNQPTFVVLEQKQDVQAVPPFWRKQLAWENGKYLSRIGHRYLSVHYVKKGDDKYEQYEISLKPQVSQWLETYKETVSGRKKHYPIEKVVFGYTNMLKLPVENFDLSRYFKISFGTGAESTVKGIAKLEIRFTIADPNVNINISVSPESPESEIMVVVVHIEASKITEDNYSFEDNDEILKLIVEAKDSAKDVFFDLATDETHKIIGAQYASSTAH